MTPTGLGHGIYGLAVIVRPHLCQSAFVRWRRTHRKKRLAKKWRKRYGAVYVCRGVAFRVGLMGWFLCPCAMRAMEKETA